MITEMLDRIADSLEAKGALKEASEVDVIANTIEALDLPGGNGTGTQARPGQVLPFEIARLFAGPSPWWIEEGEVFLARRDRIDRDALMKIVSHGSFKGIEPTPKGTIFRFAM